MSPKHYFALILAPTRELAAQVQAQCVALGQSIGLNTVLLVGGPPITDQANLMAVKPPHILIGLFVNFRTVELLFFTLATPGRFVDHLKRTKGFDEVKFKNLRFLVIDEADRMLGSDFESVIEKVLIVLPPKRQTFLFSATMTEKASFAFYAEFLMTDEFSVSNHYLSVAHFDLTLNLCFVVLLAEIVYCIFLFFAFAFCFSVLRNHCN